MHFPSQTCDECLVGPCSTGSSLGSSNGYSKCMSLQCNPRACLGQHVLALAPSGASTCPCRHPGGLFQAHWLLAGLWLTWRACPMDGGRWE